MQEIQMTRKAAAYKMHLDIMAASEVAAEAFSTFCRLLKTMRDDKLWQELEYSSFEAYCENAVGIKQGTAYGYIKAYEDFGDENSTRVEKLGIKKLRLIGAAPQEMKEDLLDQAEDMTTRQIEAAVKEYKEKLQEKEKELQSEIEWAKKQAKYADEHQNRAMAAEFELKKQKESMDSLRTDLAHYKAEMDKARVLGNPKRVEELEKLIAQKDDKIEELQDELDTLEDEYRNTPIEATATKTVEVIPDDIKDKLSALETSGWHMRAYSKVNTILELVEGLTEELHSWAYIMNTEMIDTNDREAWETTLEGAIRNLEDMMQDYKNGGVL